MADIQEQTQLANEVSEAISTSTYTGVEIDDVRPRTVLSSVCSLMSICRTSSRQSLRNSSRKSSTRGWPARSMSQYTTRLARSHRVRPLLQPQPSDNLTVISAASIQTAEEDDEEAQLKELQAALAM